MERKALAIANNDLVYLWWTYSEKIPGCLGFSVRRHQPGQPPVALPAFVGFKPENRPEWGYRRRITTDQWPIQAYQWKDLFVPENTRVTYEIVPMGGVAGEPLAPMPEPKVTSNSVARMVSVPPAANSVTTSPALLM